MIYRGQTVTVEQTRAILANRMKRLDPNWRAIQRDKDVASFRARLNNIVLGMLVVGVLLAILL